MTNNECKDMLNLRLCAERVHCNFAAQHACSAFLVILLYSANAGSHVHAVCALLPKRKVAQSKTAHMVSVAAAKHAK